MVQVGVMKMNVNIKDLMLIEQGGGKSAAKPKRRTGSKYGALYRDKTMNISLSINVQGKDLESALLEVDKYLDDAFMAGLKEVTVIHGRGEGILRNGIAQMLKRHTHVAGFRRGAYDEGGDGVTVVALRP